MHVTPLEELRRQRAFGSPMHESPRARPVAVPLMDSADPPRRENRRPVFPWVMAVLFFLLACTAGAGWWFAAAKSPVSASAGAERVGPDLSAQKQRATAPQRLAIERALADLRSGLPAQALSTLRKVRAENPGIPSIDYLVALASLQAGEREEAGSALDSALAKGERVSDALALRAALAVQAEGGAVDPVFGSLEPDADRFLREAIEADPANPYPYFELATRLRTRGDHAGAKKMLESARVRLQPIDAHTAVDVSLRLLELQGKNDADLPDVPSQATGATDLFGAAYLCFRQRRLPEASEFLRKAGAILPPDLFAYLLADPAFAPYRRHLQQDRANLVP
jgi:tetratricopeptide (TPR) repeat protein